MDIHSFLVSLRYRGEHEAGKGDVLLHGLFPFHAAPSRNIAGTPVPSATGPPSSMCAGPVLRALSLPPPVQAGQGLEGLGEGQRRARRKGNLLGGRHRGSTHQSCQRPSSRRLCPLLSRSWCCSHRRFPTAHRGAQRPSGHDRRQALPTAHLLSPDCAGRSNNSEGGRLAPALLAPSCARRAALPAADLLLSRPRALTAEAAVC